MCMLCVIPPNVIPSREKLENSALNNPHGFGFAIVVPSEKRIISERTMNADESINNFLKLREQYREGYAMWHARYATHGTMTIDNCHPFKLGGKDKQTYVAHNGVLPTIEAKGENRSDTRIFVEDILPAMGGVTALDNPQLYNVIENFTSGSKVCVLTIDPRAQFQCYLIHEDRGKTDLSGVWWSNESCYLDWGWTYKTNSKPISFVSEIDDEESILCGSCNTLNNSIDVEIDVMCRNCGICFDCSAYYDVCMCYKPSSADKKFYGGWDF